MAVLLSEFGVHSITEGVNFLRAFNNIASDIGAEFASEPFVDGGLGSEFFFGVLHFAVNGSDTGLVAELTLEVKSGLNILYCPVHSFDNHGFGDFFGASFDHHDLAVLSCNN